MTIDSYAFPFFSCLFCVTWAKKYVWRVIGPGMKWKNLYVYSSIRQYKNMQRKRRKAEDRPENRQNKIKNLQIIAHGTKFTY